MDLSFHSDPDDARDDDPCVSESAPRSGRDDPFALLRGSLARHALLRLYRERSGVLAWPLLQKLGRAAAPAPLPAAHGALLYQLARLLDARLIVAAGTSGGIAAIWLACALRESGRRCGDRCLIGLEPSTSQAQLARAALRAATVSRYADIREGAVFDEIERIDVPVDLLYIDRHPSAALGAPLALIQRLLPRLHQGSAIVIEHIRQWPQAAAWLRDPANGFTALTLPYPAGVELLVRK